MVDRLPFALLLLMAVLSARATPSSADTSGASDAQDARVARVAELVAIHAFRGSDGAWPRGSLARSGSTLYGRTAIGGASNSGTVFHIDVDGSSFGTLHEFSAGGDNRTGNQPHHQWMLLLGGDTLVGAALFGGNTHHPSAMRPSTTLDGQPTPPATAPYGNGTLFALGTDGTRFRPLIEFDGGDASSSCPHSTPALAPNGVDLWGMTALGGAHQGGTLYTVRTDGGGYRILHSFEKATGHQPHGLVVLDSAARRLLGIARSGGRTQADHEGAGTVFAYDLASGRYDVLHTFESGRADNGATNDHGFLELVDGVAYAVTELGGKHGEGTVFAIGEHGTDFRVVHSFGDGATDGRRPFGSLVRVGDWLYGTTTLGGARGDGTVFRYRPPDGPYELVASFDRATSGAFPEDNVVASADGSTLYGLTQAGGRNDPTATLYYGTIFALALPAER